MALGTLGLLEAIEEELPDIQVFADIDRVLSKEATDGVVAIELDDKWVFVPITAQKTIITKAVYKENIPHFGFGTYKVMVAIGALTTSKGNQLNTEYCFTTLHYNEAKQMFTLDFHSEAR